MSRTRHAGHTTGHPLPQGGHRVLPARTPGHLGINDDADPNVRAAGGDTPGPSGVGDHPPPGVPEAGRPGPAAASTQSTGLPIGDAVPAAWLQLRDEPDFDVPTVGIDPTLSAALPPRDENGPLIERLPANLVARVETEAREAAERMERFSGVVARHPDQYAPLHSGEPGHPVIGYWWQQSHAPLADGVVPDVRILYDVQGREVARETGGVEQSVLQADDVIPFGRVAGLGRRAVTSGGRLASRAVTALARRAVRRSTFDLLRQALAQAVRRAPRAAATGLFEQAADRIRAPLRAIRNRLDDIVANSVNWRPGTSGLTPEQLIRRVVQSVADDVRRILDLRRTPFADGVDTMLLDGLNPQ